MVETKTWSWSRRGAAKKCQLSYYLQYVQGAPKEVPDFIHAGRDSHTFLEFFFGEIAVQGTDPKMAIRQARNLVEDGTLKADDDLVGSLEWLVGVVPLPGEGETATVEEKILSDDGSLVGIADYVVRGENTLDVWDWKTGWQLPSSAIEQCMWYAYLILRDSEWKPETIHVNAANPGKMDWIGGHQSYDEIMSFGKRIEAEIDEFRVLDDWSDSTPPPATVTPDCSRCWVRRSCHKYVEFLDIDDFKDPAQAWALRAALKDRMKRLDDYLKETVSKNEVECFGGRLGIQDVEAWRFDAKAAWPILRDMGLKTEDLLERVSISGTNMMKLVPDEDEFGAMKDAFGKKTTSRRLKHWKC